MPVRNDLLIIVPTKGRAHLMERLLTGIWRTVEAPVDIVLVVCESDLAYHATVQRLWEDYSPPAGNLVIQLVSDEANYPFKVNAAAEQHAHRYRYLAIFNDDHEPITPGWDRIMKEALADDPFGVAYGPDGVWEKGQVATAPMLTASMYQALGWVALPGLQHILVDNVWKDLATYCDTLHWLPEVRIQHHHLDNGEAPMDLTYAETQNNEARNQEDRERWWSWMGSRTEGIQPDSEAAHDLELLKGLWHSEA